MNDGRYAYDCPTEFARSFTDDNGDDVESDIAEFTPRPVDWLIDNEDGALGNIGDAIDWRPQRDSAQYIDLVAQLVEAARREATFDEWMEGLVVLWLWPADSMPRRRRNLAPIAERILASLDPDTKELATRFLAFKKPSALRVSTITYGGGGGRR